jgi:SPP1 family predicted phage head-tail adaptor
MTSPLLTPTKSLPLGAGDMRHRVQLQQNQPTTNSFNEPVANWVDVAAVWAAIEPLLGLDIFAAQRIAAKARVRIRMRYYPGFDTSWRIAWTPTAAAASSSSGSSSSSGAAGLTQYFTPLVVIDPENRRRQLICLCAEETP